jgi:hypothetical protein
MSKYTTFQQKIQKKFKKNSKKISQIFYIMLRDLLTQKCSHNFLLILDTPEHVDSENINLKIGYGSSLYQLFSKRDFDPRARRGFTFYFVVVGCCCCCCC